MFAIYSGWFCIDITQKAGEREVQSRKLLPFFIIIFSCILCQWQAEKNKYFLKFVEEIFHKFK